MIRHRPIEELEHEREAGQQATQTQSRLSWTLGNLLLASGIYLLLYVGGLYADASYEQWAARGDNNLQPAAVVSLEPSAPNAFIVPDLNRPGQAAPVSVQEARPAGSTISRLIIPAIDLDAKVIEVGWETVEENGQLISVWQVAKYAVGHHQGSANPGESNNIVLAGHVGGSAPVFKDLIEVAPGDHIKVFSQGQQYLYVVEEAIKVQEAGVPEEVRIENARYIAPTEQELVTLITCWPPSGPDRYDQRLIVRARPYDTIADQVDVSSWSIR